MQVRLIHSHFDLISIYKVYTKCLTRVMLYTHVFYVLNIIDIVVDSMRYMR